MSRMWFVHCNWLVVCYSCPGNPRADEKYQERRGICQELVNSHILLSSDKCPLWKYYIITSHIVIYTLEKFPNTRLYRND